jgi:polyphosphate kinase 2 (PPK2 family)
VTAAAKTPKATPPRLPSAPHPNVREAEYEARLLPAQLRMRAISLAYHSAGLRGIVVVEGPDTAGKGGAIRRLTAELDPRHFQVWPIGPPTADELRQHYLHRFWQRLPVVGNIAVFDRSWYGRVLVERVERLVPEQRWRAAYAEINAFEALLVADGVRLAKFYLHVTPEEQRERLQARALDPNKWWKISEADLRAHLANSAYVEAAIDMLAATSTAAAPWHVIAANDKQHTRLAILDAVANAFAEGIDLAPRAIGPNLRHSIRDVLGVDPPLPAG